MYLSHLPTSPNEICILREREIERVGFNFICQNKQIHIMRALSEAVNNERGGGQRHKTCINNSTIARLVHGPLVWFRFVSPAFSKGHTLHMLAAHPYIIIELCCWQLQLVGYCFATGPKSHALTPSNSVLFFIVLSPLAGVTKFPL